jgi:hypothetical protein
VNRIRTQRRVFSLQDTHVFDPQTQNVLRFGVNRVVAFIGETPKALNPLAADTSYGFLPGRTSGNINVLGLTNFTGGLGSDSPYSFHWTSLQLYDDVSREIHIHSIGFGAALERMRDNMLASNSPNGNFVFHSLSDFLTI